MKLHFGLQSAPQVRARTRTDRDIACGLRAES